jgi:hypothetical protein
MLSHCKYLLQVALLCMVLSNTWAASEAKTLPPIKVGGSAESLHDSSVTDAEIAFRLIFNELLSKADESFTVKIFNNDKTMDEHFKEGKIHAIFTSSLHFLELDDLIHPTGRYVVQYGPSLKQRYLILVRRSAKKALTLADLRGGKLSVGIGHLLGKRFLDVTLLQQKLPISEHFFSEIDMTNRVNTAVVDLYFGKVDVALVPEYNYAMARELNPQIGEAITILAKSEPMVYQLVGMRYDFPQQRLNRIEPHILEQYPSKRFRTLLETFHITHFYRVTEDTLKEVKALNERYQTLMRQMQ